MCLVFVLLISSIVLIFLNLPLSSLLCPSVPSLSICSYLVIFTSLLNSSLFLLTAKRYLESFLYCLVSFQVLVYLSPAGHQLRSAHKPRRGLRRPPQASKSSYDSLNALPARSRRLSDANCASFYAAQLHVAMSRLLFLRLSSFHSSLLS